jgi:hypothetical protein
MLSKLAALDCSGCSGFETGIQIYIYMSFWSGRLDYKTSTNLVCELLEDLRPDNITVEAMQKQCGFSHAEAVWVQSCRSSVGSVMKCCTGNVPNA